MKQKVSLIVAYNRNRVIGFNGEIPWRIPEDLARFKTLTINNVVIMGRKTYESIGRPLAGRINIAITNQHNYNPTGCIIACSFENALEKARIFAKKDVFIIGGTSIYKEAVNAEIVDTYYITEVHAESSGDTFMPMIPDLYKYNEQSSLILTSAYGSIDYQYKTYSKPKYL